MADFRKFTGLVYKEFDRSTHVKELPDFNPVFFIRGLDRGFRNPTAVPIVAVDADGVWYQQQELYASGLTNPTLAELVNSVSALREFELSTMDSANAGDLQELNDLGLDFIPVKKQPGERGESYVRWKVQKLAERLKIQADRRAGYYVHPDCVETIREFENYSWPESKEGRAEAENPEKLNDHMMDALADLNAMYMHHYQPQIKKPWEGKIPGTYIEPSPVNDEDQDDAASWTNSKPDDYWRDAA